MDRHAGEVPAAARQRVGVAVAGVAQLHRGPERARDPLEQVGAPAAVARHLQLGVGVGEDVVGIAVA